MDPSLDDHAFDDIPFRGIVEQSLAGMYVIQDEVFHYVNATFAGMLGYTPEEMDGMHLRQAVVDDHQDEAVANYHRRVSGEKPSIRYQTSGRHKDGHPVLLDVHGSRLLYRGRPAVVGVGINITEQVKQQEALRQSREQLRELTAHINQVREEQRTRISRELHDVVGGMLTSIKLDIQRIKRRNHDPAIADIVDGLLDLVQESVDVVRSISEDLRPGLLDHLGLEAALRQALDQFSQRTDLHCRLDSDNWPAHLAPAKATAVYRICQEALTNIARHADASQVTLTLRRSAQQLQVHIDDNGRGFANPPPTGKRIGLLSMAERAREFGGSLSTAPGPQGGSRLILTLPSDDAEP